jgi:hypothetical protein
MCEPFMIASMAIAVVSAVAGGVQSNQQAKAQASHAEAQARANDVWTNWQQDRQYEQDSRTLGQAIAQQAASGIAIEGSKSDALSYLAVGQGLEREKIRYSGAAQSNSLLADAAFRRGAGTAALTNAAFQAGESLIGGLGKLPGPAPSGGGSAGYSRPLTWISNPGRPRPGAGGYLPGGI